MVKLPNIVKCLANSQFAVFIKALIKIKISLKNQLEIVLGKISSLISVLNPEEVSCDSQLYFAWPFFRFLSFLLITICVPVKDCLLTRTKKFCAWLNLCKQPAACITRISSSIWWRSICKKEHFSFSGWKVFWLFKATYSINFHIYTNAWRKYYICVPTLLP